MKHIDTIWGWTQEQTEPKNNSFIYFDSIEYRANEVYHPFLVDQIRELRGKSLIDNFIIRGIKFEYCRRFENDKKTNLFENYSHLQIKILDIVFEPISLIGCIKYVKDKRIYYNRTKNNGIKLIIAGNNLQNSGFIYFDEPIRYPYGGAISIEFFPPEDFISKLDNKLDIFMNCKSITIE